MVTVSIIVHTTHIRWVISYITERRKQLWVTRTIKISNYWRFVCM